MAGMSSRSVPSSTLSPITAQTGHLNGITLTDISESGTGGSGVGGERDGTSHGFEMSLSGSDSSTPLGGRRGASSVEVGTLSWRDPLAALAGRSTPFNPVFHLDPVETISTTNGHSHTRPDQTEDGPTVESSASAPTASTRSSWASSSSHQNNSLDGTNSNSSGSPSDHSPSLGVDVSITHPHPPV